MVCGQKIDNTAAFRNIAGDRYFRFNYDNDYFASSDRDYTQGYSFEFAMPILKRNPLNKLLIYNQKYEHQYGVAIEHIGFTPDNIKSPLIQVGDRPFASAIMLKSFAIATDTVNHARWTSSFSVGLIGQGAFGKEMQVGIHKATGNVIPEGWQNQIRNDVVINYQIGYDKQIMRIKNNVFLLANGQASVGTLFTNASAGLTAMLGIIKPNWTPRKQWKNFQLYIYSQPKLNLVGYDATLQGGLFNDSSPYTINSSEVERLTAQHNYGVVIRSRTLFIEYSRTDITREFATGRSAGWGGIRFGFTF